MGLHASVHFVTTVDSVELGPTAERLMFLLPRLQQSFDTKSREY